MKEFNVLSIKNFIGDMPRILNENFAILTDVLGNIIDNKAPETATHSLCANGVKVTGVVDANTITANNIILKVNGKKYSLLDIIKRLEDLENDKN